MEGCLNEHHYVAALKTEGTTLNLLTSHETAEVRPSLPFGRLGKLPGHTVGSKG